MEVKTNIVTYIYGYANSSINVFCKPLQTYLSKRNMTLGDIHYFLTTYNKDKIITRNKFKELLESIKQGNVKELILLINVYPIENELRKIKNICKKSNCKIITISKNGEEIFMGAILND